MIDHDTSKIWSVILSIPDFSKFDTNEKAGNVQILWIGNYDTNGNWVLLDAPRLYASCRSAFLIVRSVERHGLHNEP